jgi:MFS family permease
MEKKIYGTQKNVVYLGLVSFLNDVASEMIFPILPFFIQALGGNSFSIGLIGGLQKAIPELLKYPFGALSDKIKQRKKIAFFGYFLGALARMLLFFAKTWQNLIFIIPLERAGKGIREAPRDALIAESVDKKDLGKGFGLQRAFDAAGGLIGSILVLFLFWVFGLGFKQIILIASVFGVLALIPFIFIKEPKRTEEKISGFFKEILEKIESRKFKKFLVVSCIFAFGNFSYMFFVLKSSAAFPISLSVVLPIVLYIICSFFYTIFSEPIGKISDKYGKKSALEIGYILFGLLCLGFIFTKSMIGFIFLFSLYGIFLAILDANQKAYASSLLEKEKGGSLGLLQTSTGICGLLGNLVAGFISYNFGYALLFFYGLTLSLVSLVVFVWGE